MANEFIGKIPAADALKKRFSFVDNAVLQANLAIYLQYIIFLIVTTEELKLPGPIRYSIYKDIILHTATIVEGVTYYCVKKYLQKGLIKSEDVMPFGWKDDGYHVLHNVPEEGKETRGIVRHKSYEKFTDSVQFKTVNDIARKAGIFDGGLYEKVENLREKRNKIHLAGLKKVDDYYREQDIKKVFEDTREIIEALEDKLRKLD